MSQPQQQKPYYPQSLENMPAARGEQGQQPIPQNIPQNRPLAQPSLPQNKKILTLSKTRTLVDLNNDTVNFEMFVRVVSRNREPFEALVVTQSTLDNNPNLEYKKVQDGDFSVSMTQNKGIYQNYLLVLKADNPCDVEVEIIKKELPKTQPQLAPPPLNNKKDGSSIPWKKIILIFGIIAAGCIVYYLWTGKLKPVLSNKPEKSEHNSVSMSKSHHSASKSAEENPLLKRLRNLNL